MRFERHHISVHATFCRGEARLTPLFLGANPAVVHDAGRAAVAPPGAEEQLGFELLHTLSAEERAAAVWAGAHEPGVGHYYRIAGPLDNTQNGANHIHTVVRDPVSDFGDDVLAAHVRAAHAPPHGPSLE